MTSKNPITIELLETLDAIERRGSFSKAAEELNKATSAVSYIVQKLEEQLDISIFQRQGRRSVLTPAGRLILAEGREIVQTTTRLANKAKEVATGWEARISIAIESLQSYPKIFALLKGFIDEHPTIEIDVRESVLNGGWDALEQGKVDLIIGSPGPVPLQKGFRAVPLTRVELIPVIASDHIYAKMLKNRQPLKDVLLKVRRVVTHDTSLAGVTRSEGLSSDGTKFYVENIDQKVEAILAGIGVGHLPKQRIQHYIDNGSLTVLDLNDEMLFEHFLAWKIGNKGKGLKALTQLLSEI